MYRVNFSGHPVEGIRYAPFVGFNFGTTQIEIVAQVRQALEKLPERDQLLAGELAEIVLPGLAHVAAILLAQWHGEFGNWPTIRWSVRDDQTARFVYPSEAVANLNQIREHARVARNA